MGFKSYSGEGIILAKRKFGEADRILVVLSKYHGKVSLLAKGVRKPMSRKRGHIEVFNHIRFQAVSTNSLDLVTEVEIINSFEKTKLDLKKISLAYYLIEVVGRVLNDEERNDEIYDLLLSTLTKLEETNKLKSLRAEFMERILVLLGFLPEGKKVHDLDGFLEDVMERKVNSLRVGRKVLQ